MIKTVSKDAVTERVGCREWLESRLAVVVHFGCFEMGEGGGLEVRRVHSSVAGGNATGEALL